MWDCHWHVWNNSFLFETRLTHIWDLTHSYVWHFHKCDIVPHMCGMTHSCLRHDSLIFETWLIHMCDILIIVTLSLIYVKWLIPIWDMTCYIWDMTHSYVWRFHDCDIVSHMCEVTNPYLRHDSFIFETWLIHMCDVFLNVILPFICVEWLTPIWDMTHS